MTGRPRVGGAVARAACAVVVLVSLVVLFAPGRQVPGAAPGVDLVVHVAVFLALAVAGRWAGARPRALALALAGYAAASEVVQALAPLERSGSLGDWAADLLGAALGLAAWAAAERARAPRRPQPAPRPVRR